MNELFVQVFEHGISSNRFVMLSIIVACCALFLGIVLLQSGYDKARNFTGNLDYIKSVFSKTPLIKAAGFLLVTLAILELISGLVSLTGVAFIIAFKGAHWAGFGCVLSAVTLICLLFGQRIAKDYAGAASLTGYFVVALLGMFAYAFSA